MGVKGFSCHFTHEFAFHVFKYGAQVNSVLLDATKCGKGLFSGTVTRGSVEVSGGLDRGRRHGGVAADCSSGMNKS